MESKPEPLVVIVGETASGKSALALELAERFNGEIVCADSRTIYKEMDIGTAKPSKADQAKVRHHLLNMLTPDQKFSVAQFKQLANIAIEDIQGRGKLPIMVGGTGLYVNAVIYDFQFATPELRANRDPINPRHLNKSAKPVKTDLRPSTLLIGLKSSPEKLRQHIEQRVNEMFDQGLEREVKALSQKYGWGIEAMTAVGYREFKEANQQDLIKKLITTHTLQYAKRQRTWFKRNKSIHWLNDPRKVVEIVTTFLNKNP